MSTTAACQAIDLVVWQFTPETKREIFEHHALTKDILVRQGIWDSEFTPDQLVAEMDAAGVSKVLIPAQCAGIWEVSYEYTRDTIRQYPDRLYGMAGVDPRDIKAGLQRLELGIREYGFVGAHSYPHWFRLTPDDRAYYPFYAKCVELDIPIQVQAGQAHLRDLRSVGRPGAFDTIAVDFPDLKIIGIHTGYPWEREMISVAWKHPNVYIGADNSHPSTWPPELIEFIKGSGREKVLWGTNKPVLEFKDALAAVDELGLDPETKEYLLRRNAERVYQLS